MAIKKTDDIYYTEIANAIREKNGSLTKYKPGQMAEAILALPDGNVFCFVRVFSWLGGLVRAIKGEITIIGDATGDCVLAIPESGLWTITDGTNSKNVELSVYGSSTTIVLGVHIVQEYVPAGAQVTWSDEVLSDTAIRWTISWTQTTGLAPTGFVFDTGVNTSCITMRSGASQYGLCGKDARLPRITTDGDGRGWYSSNANTTSPQKGDNYFFAAIYNLQIGKEHSIVLDITGL